MEDTNQINRQKYFKYQFDISTGSELYGNNVTEHGSKIITLFAEVYASLVKLYGTDITKDAMLKFENCDTFKNWFWNVKHRLGTVILRDPQFDDIGLWLGKGLYLKIILSTIKYNNLILTHDNLARLIARQDKLIKKFVTECDKKYFTANCICRTATGYTILGENVCIGNCSNLEEINLI
ncbi:MAG: hypothetical protein IKQ61_04945 [Spirochaetales bacterium]|nr:hypothetical protein [Spirochaetales bacterium]